MSDSTYTHKDLSALLGVSETTIKSYRRKFPGCIPVASKGKPIRFTAAAVAVSTRIRDLFEEGMSVEEVHARLTSEFDWIPKEGVAGDDDPSLKEAAKGAYPGPEISMGVSNMAKSMVAMTQQQKSLLARVESMEKILDRIALAHGGSDALREKEELLEDRLGRLDAATQQLTGTVQTLVLELARFVQQQKRSEQAMKNGETSVSGASEQEKTPDSVSASHNEASQEAEKSGPIRLRLRHDTGQSQDGNAKAQQDGATAPGSVKTSAASEPPRHFLGLPMVVRTEEGRYISAGGKGKGRFSVNDLKAMLIYGFTPPNHFAIKWEAHGQGWWLYLNQEHGERSFHLLLMELPTQRGGNVTEILQLKRNGETLHPAEISAIIDSLSK